MSGGRVTSLRRSSVAVSPVRRPDFSWLIRGTFSLNRSKIEELPVPAFLTGGFGLSLGAYKIEEGKSASMAVLEAKSESEALARLAPPLFVIRAGDVIVRRTPSVTELIGPGEKEKLDVSELLGGRVLGS